MRLVCSHTYNNVLYQTSNFMWIQSIFSPISAKSITSPLLVCISDLTPSSALLSTKQLSLRTQSLNWSLKQWVFIWFHFYHFTVFLYYVMTSVDEQLAGGRVWWCRHVWDQGVTSLYNVNCLFHITGSSKIKWELVAVNLVFSALQSCTGNCVSN